MCINAGRQAKLPVAIGNIQDARPPAEHDGETGTRIALFRANVSTRRRIMQILVVEDDFISRRLLCRYLEPYGECDVAINGNEALAAVRQALASGNNYDLICLDIMMPGITGQEALEQIRALELENGLGKGFGARVIMTTALEDEDSMNQAYEAEADGYVTKPIDKRGFQSVLQELGLGTKVEN
jgi:two-component system chemotaxis response regulator CheY